jgi:Na+-translocating ferredoxin:NAD+ oxidoreductase RNF subunit RnfB
MILAELQSIGLAGLTMVVLGGSFAVILLVASIKLKVVIDPKVEQIHEALPNIDCGACGFAGCGQYAKAVAEDPELLGKCAPGGSETAEAVAGILNLQVSTGGAPQRPVVHCRANTEDRTYYAKYSGIPSCTAANAAPNVQACKFGCLGYGDCVISCKFDALHIADGLATVDYEKCTGCTACSKACPRDLIEMVPFNHDNMMVAACSSFESGKSTRGMCNVGCIACKMCTKKSELFSMGNNNARMDYEKYEPSEQTETAMSKCPTGVIVYRGKNAPAPREAGQKAKPAATA